MEFLEPVRAPRRASLREVGSELGLAFRAGDTPRLLSLLETVSRVGEREGEVLLSLRAQTLSIRLRNRRAVADGEAVDLLREVTSRISHLDWKLRSRGAIRSHS